MAYIALRFGPDLVAAIEKNRRRSSATSRIFRLSCDQRWPEDEMQDDHVIFLQALTKFDLRLLTKHHSPCQEKP
jgi:hypothetical protein